jgi:arylsulfatase A-like enzyme
VEGTRRAGVLRGEREGVRDTVFLAYRDVQRAVRRGAWKLIRYPQVDKTQLFNLDNDPYEMNDLAGDARQAARVKELMGAMREQQELYGDRAPLTVENPRAEKVGLDYFSAP